MNIYTEFHETNDCEKLKWIIAEIDHLMVLNVAYYDDEFEAWHIKTERFLIHKFGANSFEHQKFICTNFKPTDETKIDGRFEENIYQAWCEEGLRSCRVAFKTYLEDMVNEDISTSQTTSTNKPCNLNKIFIVHGHDGELKQSVARLIEKQNIDAIILSEQVNQGRTIIEKFEDYSDVSGAICLFSADDFGRAKADEIERHRARQNVVFEAGYFMGKLDRSRVVIIAENEVELPSDMQGIVYTNKNNWEIDVLKELKAMGYSIDFNKLFQ